MRAKAVVRRFRRLGVEARLLAATRVRLDTLSRRALAKQAQVPYSTLDHWERGINRISFDQAIRLARALRLTFTIA